MRIVPATSSSVKQPRNPIPIGTRFVRLVVTGNPVNTRGNHYSYPCRCDCGTEKIVSGENMRSGTTVSCGCRMREAHHMKKHGMRKTRLYHIWQQMIQRCANPKRVNYARYGGKGIRVCQEWKDFSTFSEWALSHGYSDDLTIDRISSAGDYSPRNCRWSTVIDQARNQRSNHLLTVFGVTKCIAEWAEDARCVVSRGTLQCRIQKGWDVERAITEGRHNTHTGGRSPKRVAARQVEKKTGGQGGLW
jgi:hypothetical protein